MMRDHFASLALLAACSTQAGDRTKAGTGGSAIVFSGPICGSDQPISIELADAAATPGSQRATR